MEMIPRAGVTMTRATVLALPLVVAAAVVTGGCSDAPASPNPKPRTAPVCVTRDPGPSPLRRLTRREYQATVNALLGDGLVDGSSLPADERALGFDNNADVVTESGLLIEMYADLAERAGEAVAADVNRFVPCGAGAAGVDQTCARGFANDLARRAWRRPIDADESAMLAGLIDGGVADGGGVPEGIARATAVILGSPQFLYRIESEGASATELANAVALSPHELASRLSYLMWGTTPDAALIATADAGRLATREDLAREARRLIDDPRARAAVTSFHTQWLGLDRLDDLDKDKVVFPAFNPGLRELFRQETVRFVDEVIWNGDGTLAALLTSSRGFVNATMAGFYGVAPPARPGPDGFGAVEFDPARRAGLLTQASLLAVHAKANQSSPVHRGVFVREQLLCTTPPPPPANVQIRAPGLDPRKTTRERFSDHVTDASCQACHHLLDPIGFGFEHYDGVGAWRDSEGGRPVDAHGTLTGTDVDGDFDGAVALSSRLATSGDVNLCYARQWFRFAYGRGETMADSCTLGELAAAFAEAKGDVRALLLALTQTDAFRFRRAGETL